MDLCRLTSPSYKILHLVRHAQGVHNVALEENGQKPESEKLFDADLSPMGLQQVFECHKRIRQLGLLNTTELVITSPLLRAMKTSTGIFRGQEKMNQYDDSPKANIQPPILAHEICRERMGLYPCDRRERISNRQASFSEIDFRMIENDEDTLWQAEEREKLEDVAKRSFQFLKWVWERPEKEIAIVSHGIFLQQTLLALHPKLDIPHEDSDLLSRFANCELRSIRIEKSDMEAGTLTAFNCRKYATPPPSSTSINTLK